jgi:hypothetical protein
MLGVRLRGAAGPLGGYATQTFGSLGQDLVRSGRSRGDGFLGPSLNHAVLAVEMQP